MPRRRFPPYLGALGALAPSMIQSKTRRWIEAASKPPYRLLEAGIRGGGAAIAVLLVATYVVFHLRENGRLSAEAALAIAALADVAIVAVLIAWAVSALRGSERQRQTAMQELDQRLREETDARARAENSMVENERRFRAMVEESINGIVLVDAAGTIRHANPRAGSLLGYLPGELDGKPIEDLVPAARRESHARLRTKYRHAPTPRGMDGGRELAARCRDGRSIPVEVVLQPLETLEGPQIMATLFDISERVRVREALEDMNRQLEQRVAERTTELAEANSRAQEANRLKSEFLANMSHELRTPLNAIIGFADVLAIEKPGPLNAEQKDCLHEVISAGRHLQRLISDLLDLGRIEAGKLAPVVAPFALIAVLGEVVSSVTPLAAGRQISLTVETAGLEDDAVVLDPKMTKQILYNLLSNALKFTPEGGAVSVHARPEANGFIAIGVSDTGIGISADDVGRLFQRFNRLDDARSLHAPGTGLGLAISRTLAELQGGSICVQSEVDRGSTFTVRLPREFPSNGFSPDPII